ncbi:MULTISPECIES: diguanylate cyclase [Micrococcaceae]|uniref:Diguanylate cyclase (GGDEF)-like protein n=1 Tax=Pseudarthrobacter siccitolerans TaxID=861266 RepID=A0ABU0PQF0_9MICC|nr:MULTISPECIES: diguanylate cyclase [Micrococcaceae]MDQ0676175.1 diguanylate cyclase (GGDEF)-like protein [Pseudarthrobacter siccitolerans]MDQ0692056.1 diguanylate cyclase (GGDEF)-like protein [Arthrobacter sp. W4I7]
MKVLVADDDPGSLMVARAAVERSGHDCLAAADGDEAWALYLEHQPDVVVTDWMMPGMDGLALCRAIRAREQDLYTYVVLLTSQGSRDDVLAGLEAGADDYVTKPLDPFVLHARLLVARRITTLHADLAHYRRVLSRQARTDPLTGLHNRLKLSEDLERLHLRSGRYEEQYSLAMCDVDNFKSYNDVYGHQAGDLALRAVAAALLGIVRKSDGVYRYGGEEFLLVLPHQSVSGAKALMERALDAVRDLAIVHAGDPSGQLRLSAGIASFSAGHRVDAETLVGEADAALYAAKAGGRNRVELAR